MLKKIVRVLLVMGLFLSTSFVCATPSTQIWNPSTDIQKVKTWHLGIDNYYNSDANQYYLGLTYGLIKNVEVGVDLNEPSSAPMLFNAKYGLPETGCLPAVAVGIMNFGTVKDKNDYDIGYLVVAKTFNPIGRFSVGAYHGGNPSLFQDKFDKTDNTGAIVSWDRSFGNKFWGSIDYASGESSYGETSAGVSYTFADNVSIIFGYVIPNSSQYQNQVTTQLDINF